MIGKRRIVRGALVVAAVAAVAGLVASGCSTTGPESSWEGNSGSVSGSVRSDRGSAVSGIAVYLWRQAGTESELTEYYVTTDADGEWQIENVELGEPHAYKQSYGVCVNRTPGSALAINEAFGTYTSTIVVEADECAVVDIVLSEEGEPEQYVDD